MQFKDISYLELWWPICSAEWNHLCIVGPEHFEEHFCEIIYNLDKSFRRRCCLKVYLILSGSPFVRRSETSCAILVEGIIRNNSVILFLIWTSSSGDVVEDISYL